MHYFAQYNFEWRTPLSGPLPKSSVFVLTSFNGWKREQMNEEVDGGWCLARMVRACHMLFLHPSLPPSPTYLPPVLPLYCFADWMSGSAYWLSMEF